MLRVVTAIGETIARSGALSTRTLEELRQTLQVAGFRVWTMASDYLSGPKYCWSSACSGRGDRDGVTHFTSRIRVRSRSSRRRAPGSDKVVQHLRARYLSAFESGMPDALDMMVICAVRGPVPGAVSNGRY